MNINLHTYEDATHGFDSLNMTPRVIFDPTAKNMRGSEVFIVGNDKARESAKINTLQFLDNSLK